MPNDLSELKWKLIQEISNLNEIIEKFTEGKKIFEYMLG